MAAINKQVLSSQNKGCESKKLRDMIWENLLTE